MDDVNCGIAFGQQDPNILSHFKTNKLDFN